MVVENRLIIAVRPSSRLEGNYNLGLDANGKKVTTTFAEWLGRHFNREKVAIISGKDQHMKDTVTCIREHVHVTSRVWEELLNCGQDGILPRYRAVQEVDRLAGNNNVVILVATQTVIEALPIDLRSTNPALQIDRIKAPDHRIGEGGGCFMRPDTHEAAWFHMSSLPKGMLEFTSIKRRKKH